MIAEDNVWEESLIKRFENAQHIIAQLRKEIHNLELIQAILITNLEEHLVKQTNKQTKEKVVKTCKFCAEKFTHHYYKSTCPRCRNDRRANKISSTDSSST